MQAFIRPWGPSDYVVFCLHPAHAWRSRHKNYGFCSNSETTSHSSPCRDGSVEREGSPSEGSGISKE
jgi:hypothetical protein